MSGGGNFFVENAFGEIFQLDFLADDLEDFSSSSRYSAANIKGVADFFTTSSLRISTESEVLRESNLAFLSAFNLIGNLNGDLSARFSGKIFKDF